MILLAFFSALAIMMASEGEDAVRRLASRLPGKGPYSVIWQNVSTIPAEDVERLKKTLEASVDLQPAGGAQELKITFSENLRGYLLIAQGLEGKVWIESWPKPPSKLEKPTFRLARTVIWEQPSPILDVAVSGDEVYVLEPMRITGRNIKPPVGLTLPRPMPRDPRGRIDVTGTDYIRVLLPGVRCTGPLQKLSCVIAKEPWIVAGRNYFDGPRGRYYTAAESGGAVFQAETDGRTRIYSGGGDAARVLEGWGSEIITLESGCGIHVLASLETGQLQAFQYTAGNVHATTVPLVLDGVVTAIWPSEKKNQVTVIVNNRTTGNYEASRVAVLCSE
jgi:hypothetical protein